ncbi:centromere protein W [Polypterus senegalus]|uniref:centromere protein W n=1 Tax=Polypterus senegalus TaxID=55291 RepID=UPI001966AFF0|nr:centromere protein W [Polypterus senegalus]
MKKPSGASLKAVLKKRKPNLVIGKNVDALLLLNYLLFTKRLAEESRAKAFEKRSATIRENHCLEVVKAVLKKTRG